MWTISAVEEASRRRACPGERLRDEQLRLHERLVARDRRALLECLDRFGPIVYWVAMTETDDGVLAEAVTERLFVDLWLQPHAFHPERGPIGLQLAAAVPECARSIAHPAHPTTSKTRRPSGGGCTGR